MAIPSYSIGSAAAETLSRLGDMHRADATPFRPVDLVNIAAYDAREAHELLLTDVGTARDLLINGASRMIRAAEMLETHVQGRTVAPLRVVS